jgi:hypothetical protein
MSLAIKKYPNFDKSAILSDIKKIKRPISCYKNRSNTLAFLKGKSGIHEKPLEI